MEEKEICLKSNVSFEEIKNIMFDIGFKVQEDFQMNDIYMINKDVDISLDNKDIIFKDNILVRETVGKRTLLVNKIKKLDDNGVVIGERKVKCPIADSLSGYNFLCSIGYKKVFELKDHNLLVTNGVNEIYIQDVEGLGTYIEMEQKNLLLKNTNGDTIEELVNTIKKYNLPLDYSDISVKKALEMLKNICE
ncbi:MAG: hypothetical protein SOV80_03830 [Bacilli bacterium]|nr:hypothetical protein [bacterium]MDY2697340.1 hypothetical protein [Bacilli bacterium]